MSITREKPAAKRRELPRCGRCGAPGPYGFGPPHGRENLGRVHACAAHREAAREWHRKTYHGGKS